MRTLMIRGCDLPAALAADLGDGYDRDAIYEIRQATSAAKSDPMIRANGVLKPFRHFRAAPESLVAR